MAPLLVDAFALNLNFVRVRGVIVSELQAAFGAGGRLTTDALPQSAIIANHLPSIARFPTTALYVVPFRFDQSVVSNFEADAHK